MMERPLVSRYFTSLSASLRAHSYIRQISHKGAAKDQDDGETKEEDTPRVSEVHNRVFVITVGVWILLLQVLILQIWVFLPAYSRSPCPLSRHSRQVITALEELDSQ